MIKQGAPKMKPCIHCYSEVSDADATCINCGGSQVVYRNMLGCELNKFIAIDNNHASSAAMVLQSSDYRAMAMGRVVLFESNNRTKVIEDIQTASQSVISSVTPFDREAFNRTFNANH